MAVGACWQAVRDNNPKDTHKDKTRRLKVFIDIPMSLAVLLI
ncbi:hypothetical protein [Moraxella lacunata]